MPRKFQIIGGALVVVVVGYGVASAYYLAAAPQAAAEAQFELAHGRISAARSCLSRILWFHPQNPHANLALGSIELADGETEQAIECFRKVSPESDVHPQASFQLARTYAHDGRLAEAETVLEEYLRRHQPTQPVWDLYFRLLYLQVRTRDVIALFERKLTVSPASLSDARFLLKAEFVPQEPRAALDVLEIIHRKHPDDINAQVALAIALSRTDDQSRAELLLRAVLEEQPGHQRARVVLSQWLADRQEFSRAKEVLWQGRDAPDPQAADGIHDDERFWVLSSRLAERDANPHLALQYIDRALQIRANDKQALSQRAQILRRLSRKEEAAVTGQMAIDAGRIEQELFLLARQLEHRPIRVADGRKVARLYRELGRPARAELWERLEQQSVRTQKTYPALEGTTIP